MSMNQNGGNGTEEVLSKLNQAWRAMRDAIIYIDEINRGNWKEGQDPLCFTSGNSSQLASSIAELEHQLDYLTRVARKGSL